MKSKQNLQPIILPIINKVCGGGVNIYATKVGEKNKVL